MSRATEIYGLYDFKVRPVYDDTINIVIATDSVGTFPDLDLTGISLGQGLTWDGSKLVAATLGTGDVTAGASITDNRIVRGDGGAKGIQESAWSIADSGKMTSDIDISGDYILEVHNTNATSGSGFSIRAGEALGDIAFHIADNDDTFQIMECEADQGFVTFGKTYAQTLTDNGVVFGIDNQHGTNPGSADINTQNGQFKMGGLPIPLKTYCFFMDQVEYPRGSDWDVNTGAPASADSNNSALIVRRFDDGTDEAIGFIVCVPAQAFQMRITTKARAETAPGVSQTAVVVLHKREIPDNAAVGSWSTNALTNIVLPTNEFFQRDDTNAGLGAWGLNAGSTYQMQFSRDANNGSDNLSGDLSLLEIEVVFS